MKGHFSLPLYSLLLFVFLLHLLFIVLLFILFRNHSCLLLLLIFLPHVLLLFFTFRFIINIIINRLPHSIFFYVLLNHLLFLLLPSSFPLLVYDRHRPPPATHPSHPLHPLPSSSSP